METQQKTNVLKSAFDNEKAIRKGLVAKTKTKDQKKDSKKVSRNKEAIGHKNYFVKQTKTSPRTKLNTKINENLFCSDCSGQPRFQ
jgi:formylmethanofuran dehydrogenase subunit E